MTNEFCENKTSDSNGWNDWEILPLIHIPRALYQMIFKTFEFFVACLSPIPFVYFPRPWEMIALLFFFQFSVLKLKLFVLLLIKFYSTYSVLTLFFRNIIYELQGLINELCFILIYIVSLDTGHKLNAPKTFRKTLDVFWTSHVYSVYVLRHGGVSHELRKRDSFFLILSGRTSFCFSSGFY